MMQANPGHGLADGAGHAGSGAFGGAAGSACDTTQPECARELADEEVAFGVGLRGPLCVPRGAGLVEVVVDLCQASAVGGLGCGVEELTGVTYPWP